MACPRKPPVTIHVPMSNSWVAEPRYLQPMATVNYCHLVRCEAIASASRVLHCLHVSPSNLQQNLGLTCYALNIRKRFNVICLLKDTQTLLFRVDSKRLYWTDQMLHLPRKLLKEKNWIQPHVVVTQRTVSDYKWIAPLFLIKAFFFPFPREFPCSPHIFRAYFITQSSTTNWTEHE